MCPSRPVPLALIDDRSTDEEIIMLLGGQKVGDPIPSNVITEVNPFSIEPWDSPGNMWYLFNSENSNFHTGGSDIKVTEIGYWRLMNDLRILTIMPTVGRKTTREFYLGQSPFGDRTGWIMHEYQADLKPHFGVNKVLHEFYNLYHFGLTCYFLGTVSYLLTDRLNVSQEYSSLYRVFLQNEQRINSKEQDNSVNVYDGDGEYSQSRLPSLLEQEESKTSGDHVNRIQVAVGDERSQPGSSERSPQNKLAYNSFEDMHATFDFSKGDYLELNDLCSMETSSSGPYDSANYDFSKGDYLELNDLFGSETSSSNSDNSSLMSMNSDEYFDPDALLKELENECDLNVEEENVNRSFNLSTTVKSNQVVIRPPLQGFVRTINSNLVVEESTSTNSTPGNRRALGPDPSSSDAQTRHSEKAVTSGTSKGSRANRTRGRSQRFSTQGPGSRPAGRIAKLGKKYFCFALF